MKADFGDIFLKPYTFWEHICCPVVYEETSWADVDDPGSYVQRKPFVKWEASLIGISGSYLNSEQRPLKTIAIKSGDVYIPRGVSVPALDKDILWEFQPKKLGLLQKSLLLIPLFLLGSVFLRPYFLRCLGGTCAIPGASGCRKTVAGPLQGTLFLNLEFQGVKKASIPCFRPVAEKLAADTPLLTWAGKRVAGPLPRHEHSTGVRGMKWQSAQETPSRHPPSHCLAGKKQEADDGDVNRDDERLVFRFAMRNEKPVKEEAGDCP
nr:V-type proton ATPase catalytic subunit A [Ipomoea batatas]